MKTLDPIPKIGEKYWFYADDKVRTTTEYEAEIVGIYSIKEADDKLIYKYNPREEECVGYKLLDLWGDEVPMVFWILAEDTDCFIEAKIPELCPQSVYFARTVDGGWHAFEIYSSLQFGILDVTGDLYKSLHETYTT